MEHLFSVSKQIFHIKGQLTVSILSILLYGNIQLSDACMGKIFLSNIMNPKIPFVYPSLYFHSYTEMDKIII